VDVVLLVVLVVVVIDGCPTAIPSSAQFGIIVVVEVVVVVLVGSVSPVPSNVQSTNNVVVEVVVRGFLALVVVDVVVHGTSDIARSSRSQLPFNPE